MIVRNGLGRITPAKPSSRISRATVQRATGKHPIAGIVVDLEHSGKVAKMLGQPLALAIGHLDVDDRRRIGAASRPVIASVGLELPGLFPTAAPAPALVRWSRREQPSAAH